MTHSLRRALTSPYLFMPAATLAWASNVLLVRAIHEQITSISLNFWRWLIAFGLMLLIARPVLRRQWPVLRREWIYVGVMGALGVALFHTFSYFALKATTAVNVGFINSVAPITIVAMSWLLYRDPLSWRQALGIAVSLVGVSVIITRGDPELLARMHFNSGDLWSLSGMPAWAAFTVLLKRKPPDMEPKALLVGMFGVGAALLLPLYLVEIALGRDMALNAVTLGAAVYVGVVPSTLGYVLWNAAVPQVGPNKAGLFLHLIPVFTTVLAILFLGERLHGFHVVAMLLIFSGIYLTTRVSAAPSPQPT